MELNCFVNCLFPLFLYFKTFCCHLNEITFDLFGIMMGSYYSQLQESGNKLDFGYCCLQKDEPGYLGAPERNALGYIFSLEHYSVCAKDYSCCNTSLSDWTSNFFYFLWCAAWYSECWWCCSKYFQSIHFTDLKEGGHVHRKATFGAKIVSFFKKIKQVTDPGMDTLFRFPICS